MFFDNSYLFFLGCGGAAALELLKLYDYRGKLTQKKYTKMMSSFSFWIVVIGMLVASGFITWALHTDSQEVKVWHVVITGMAARSITRDVISLRVSNASTKLGSDDVTLRDIFS